MRCPMYRARSSGDSAVRVEPDGLVDDLVAGDPGDGDLRRHHRAGRLQVRHGRAARQLRRPPAELEHWQIPESHWAAICSAAPSGSPAPHDPAIGTVLAWESATQAEHLHGPLLTRMLREGTGRAQNDKIAVFRTPAARKGSRLVILNRIYKYATLLARQCDDLAGTDIDLDGLLGGIMIGDIPATHLIGARNHRPRAGPFLAVRPLPA